MPVQRAAWTYRRRTGLVGGHGRDISLNVCALWCAALRCRPLQLHRGSVLLRVRCSPFDVRASRAAYTRYQAPPPLRGAWPCVGRQAPPPALCSRGGGVGLGVGRGVGVAAPPRQRECGVTNPNALAAPRGRELAATASEVKSISPRRPRAGRQGRRSGGFPSAGAFLCIA